MLQWRDELSVKIADIDEQHKRLIGIADQINELLKAFDDDDHYDQILHLLDDLTAYTIYHFQREEALMKRYDFPELVEHQKEHQSFIEKLKQYDYHHIDENQQQVLSELLSFLVSWIFKHIMNTDFRYSDFLVSSMEK